MICKWSPIPNKCLPDELSCTDRFALSATTANEATCREAMLDDDVNDTSAGPLCDCRLINASELSEWTTKDALEDCAPPIIND